MSDRPENQLQPDEDPIARLGRWRAEIHAFYDQTSTEIQRIIGTLDRSPSPPGIRPAVAPLPSTGVGPAAEMMSEPDFAQDRLANLKRQLAAKLSNSNLEDATGSPRNSL